METDVFLEHHVRRNQRRVAVILPHPQYGNRALFAMTFGGNGITYSVLGVGIVRDTIERHSSALSQLFPMHA